MTHPITAWRNLLKQRMLDTGQEPAPEEVNALKMAVINQIAQNRRRLAAAQQGQSSDSLISPGQQQGYNANTGQPTADQYNAGAQQTTAAKNDGGCIIVTCCHGRDSEEVDVARRFRDRFMTSEQKRGYYMIAEKVAPLMESEPALKELIKATLVDNLVSYGRKALGESKRCRKGSKEVAENFLAHCESVGKTVDNYTRKNGEKV